MRKRLSRLGGIAEVRMFGGIGYLLNGHLCCGVHGADLVVRVDPSECERLAHEPGARRFDLTGRPMPGWLLVAPDALVLDEALDGWVKRSVRYVRTLPAKRK